jgi:Flp pilus assembly protein TadD
LAQYRTGNYEAALATLTNAEAIDSLFSGSSPSALAVLAMTQFRLGQFDKATATFTRLREIMKHPRWAGDRDAQAFLHEAETLLQSVRAK